MLLAPLGSGAAIDSAAPAKFSIRPVLVYLIGYFLFGAGYIAYMTFMIAYVRDAGGGAVAQSAFWSLIGLSAFVTPWVWRRVLALDRGGLATTIILGTNAIGAALPIFGHSVWLLAISALVFGVAFFAVVGSTTAFVRFNYPPQAWPTAIAALTISFGIGQTLGAIRRRRDHRCGGQPVVRSQYFRSDAGAGGGAARRFRRSWGGNLRRELLSIRASSLRKQGPITTGIRGYSKLLLQHSPKFRSRGMGPCVRRDDERV